MATKVDATSVLTESLLSSLKQGQELAISGFKTWYDVAGKAFPLPKMETIPFAEALPDPRELLRTTFSFVEDVIALEKELLSELATVVTA